MKRLEIAVVVSFSLMLQLQVGAFAGDDSTHKRADTEEYQTPPPVPGYRSGMRVKNLADEYGVSMIPVREALARLLSSRLVRVELNRGYFVANRPTGEEFSHLVRARVIIETSALADGFNQITKADISALAALNDKMRKLAERQHQKKNVFSDWINLNGEFHIILVGTSRNPFLNSIHEGLSLDASMARLFADALPPCLNSSRITTGLSKP